MTNIQTTLLIQDVFIPAHGAQGSHPSK